jgi:hypothetical protein
MVYECCHGRSPFVDFVIVLYMVWECRHGRSPFVDFGIVLYMVYECRHGRYTIYNTITKSTNGERP